jgi:hypothetical protein
MSNLILGDPEEEEEIIDEISTSEYIAAATNTLLSIEDIDTQIMSKEDEMMFKEMRRRCYKILDYCISDFYFQLFDE